MSLAAFDTLAYVKKLEVAGMPTKQAEAQVELQSQIFSDVLLEKLATKENFNTLDIKIDKVEANLDAKIDRVETALNARIDKVETTLNAKIDRVEANLNAKIDRVEANLNTKIDRVETTLNAKIDKVAVELKSDIQQLKVAFDGKLTLIHWMLGFLLSGNAALLLKFFA